MRFFRNHMALLHEVLYVDRGKGHFSMWHAVLQSASMQ